MIIIVFHINQIFNKKAYSLLEILISITITGGIILSLISFVNLVVGTNIRYLVYTRSYDQANFIINIISNDLRSYSSLLECGQSLKNSCSFKYKDSEITWKVIPNPKYSGKFSLRKILKINNQEQIIFESDPFVSLTNDSIFEYYQLPKYNSSTKSEIVGINLQFEISNYSNTELKLIERSSKILLKSYDQSL